MSSYKRLFIFVEGNDDENFFEHIIIPKLSKKFLYVKIYKYSQKQKKKLKNFIRSIKSMGADYIFLTDINNSPRVSDKKFRVIREIGNISEDNIVVVVKEIESWYLAGVKAEDCHSLGIPFIRVTDEVTKEQFNKLIPGKFDSRIDFMMEILKVYSHEEATRRNKSFKYFYEKYLTP